MAEPYIMQFKGRHAGAEWLSQRGDEPQMSVGISLTHGYKLSIRLNDVTTVVAVPPEAVEALFDMFAASVADAPEHRQHRATHGQLDYQAWQGQRLPKVDVGALDIDAVADELRMTKQAIAAHAELLAQLGEQHESADALRWTLECLQQNLPAIEAAHARLTDLGRVAPPVININNHIVTVYGLSQAIRDALTRERR